MFWLKVKKNEKQDTFIFSHTDFTDKTKQSCGYVILPHIQAFSMNFFPES